MSHLRRILQRRDEIRTELRGILETHADGNLPDEARARADVLEAEAGRLNDTERRQVLIDELDRRASGTPISGSGDKRLEVSKRAFRPGIAIAGAAGLRVDDGPEREISAEMAKRSGRKVEGVLIPFESFHRPLERRVVTPAGSGAGIIGTYLDETQYIDALRASIIMAKLGARYITGLDQNTDFPRLSATATAQWVLDGNPITTDTTEAFDKISLRPQTVGSIVEFTRNMLLTSTPAVQDAVRNDMVQVVARAIDLAALDGSGTPDPLGILNTTGLTVLPGATNGAALSWTAVLALMSAVQGANAPETALGWAGNPKVRAAAMGTLRFAGVAAGTIMEDPNQLAGYPFASTTQLPLNTKGTGTNLSTLIYGAWDEVIIGMFGEGVEVLVNPYGTPQFNSGNIAVRVLASADVAIRHIASFAALTDVIAA